MSGAAATRFDSAPQRKDTYGFSILDFFYFVTGGRSDLVFPLCWDELLDWTEHISELLSELDENKVLPTMDFEHSSQLDTMLASRFVPWVLRGSEDKLVELQSWCWRQRSRFFSDCVVISFECSSRFVCFLSFKQFCTIYSLLRRLSDHYSLRGKGNETMELERRHDDQCLICCSQTESAVLSCGHALCTDCESKWVKLQLACPFCRQNFCSAKDVIRNVSWNLTDWSSSETAGLDDDIVLLESKISQFWKASLKQRDVTSEAYRRGLFTEASRILAVVESDPDGFLVVEEQEGREALALTI